MDITCSVCDDFFDDSIQCDNCHDYQCKKHLIITCLKCKEKYCHNCLIEKQISRFNDSFMCSCCIYQLIKENPDHRYTKRILFYINKY